MYDLISRRAAKEKLEQNLIYMRAFGVDRCLGLIDELPAVKSEPKWVPCSERLPESGIFVLCSTSDMGCVIGYYVEHADIWFAHIWWHDDIEIIVNAWMPLPPCYKGE